jgi:hypothetical protein
VSISFGAGVPWGAISQPECQRRAKDSRLPLRERVQFAALGCANRIGHAEFSMGQLVRFLADEHGKAPSRQAVSNTIKRLRDVGLLAQESCARCLVVSGWFFQKNAHGTASCRTHAVRVG